MKRALVLLLATAAISQAASIQFDLSPPNTDAARGLSPANEVPAVTNSVGSGDEISGGITFDPTNRVLSLAVGFGSAAGFTNLTGAATAAHIHGPAGAGTNAGVVLSLVPFVFPANDPANGGVIFGSTVLPTNAVSDLLAGLYYLNIHTAENPGGEIRGQLVVHRDVNLPPELQCPPDSVVECSGRPTTVTVMVSDPEGDPIRVLWKVNGTPIQTNRLERVSPNQPVEVSLEAVFPLGTNLVEVTAWDGARNVVSCETTLVVLDRLPPVITGASAYPSELWPPNHKMVDIRLDVVVRDQCGPAKWKIMRVTSNEPVNGLGDGNTTPDWVITGEHGLKLRAERSGKESGRIYTVTVQAEDSAGNLSRTKNITVTVAKSQGKYEAR